MKPKTDFTNYKALPPYLQQNGLFCLWRYTERANGSGWTKVPFQPLHPKEGADCTDPASFADLRTAVNAGDSFDGLGVGIFNELGAIDIDNCIDGAGRLSKLAQTVVNTIDSYTEISPSGRGIRILFRASGLDYDQDIYYIKNGNAQDPAEEWPEKQGLEIYLPGMTSRYVTVTGRTYKSADVNDRAAQVMRIVTRYMKKPQQTKPAATLPHPAVVLSDNELIEIATRANDGGKFRSLFIDGDTNGYPSASEADLALFNSLAFYTGADVPRMIELFKKSALAADVKRKGRGQDRYIERTAKKAAAGCNKYYTPPRPRVEPVKPNAEKAVSKGQTDALIDTLPAQEPPKMQNSVGAVDLFLDKVQSKAFEPISTGIKDVDAALSGGFVRQTLVTLGAHPGAGKTIFAQQIFESIAGAGNRVLFFNLEMSAEQLIARSLSRDTGIDPLTVLRGYSWNRDQEAKIISAATRYKRTIAPFIAYNPTDQDGRAGSPYYQDIISIMQSEAEISDKPPLVVIDYLQLLRDKENRGEDADTIKAALIAFKNFAIRYNTVVFCIMAHNRAVNRSGAPSLESGRDTSAIEYSADMQLSLHYTDLVTGKYDSVDKMRKAVEAGNADANIFNARSLVTTKNRFGADRARVDMVFIGEESRFSFIDRRHEEPRAAVKRI